MLKGKEIVLGVTGGIAAYKAAEFLRLLVKREASVHVVMTRNAQEFVTPLTFQTLSGKPVVTDPFALIQDEKIAHIALADLAELVVILPATANILGKIAAGIADDFLSTLVMATRAPVLLAPSMNVNMWESAAVKKNVEILIQRGFHFIEPGEGELACGWCGKGRLAELEDVIEKIEDLFTEKDLAGERFLVTAGPTQEPIDPVRFLTNRSSGKMGYALALMAKRRGGEVVLISGPTSLRPPRPDIRIVSVRTAEEMRKAVSEHLPWSTVVIKAAAVSDYRPKTTLNRKLKKGERELSLQLEQTADILAEIGRNKGDRLVVGFAAETDELVANARKKLTEKNLDLIVANDVTRPDAGFEAETNLVKLLFPSGEIREPRLASKEEVASLILNEIAALLRNRKAGL
jgi:phosphopantothenoylcysteine decarboxylase/phosphopantothenate--cysteine ligase